MIQELFKQLAKAIELGNASIDSAHLDELKGREGAREITQLLLESGASAKDILQNGLVVGIEKVGIKFRDNKIFVPHVLLASKAMNEAMNCLRPYIVAEKSLYSGEFIIGTVEGDLHDIGKNLVAMILEGNGYKVIDLGTDVSASMFIEAVLQYPEASIGLSALLTTTMINMESIVREIRKIDPDRKICIGGAPVTEEFKNRIKADVFSTDPQSIVDFLKQEEVNHFAEKL